MAYLKFNKAELVNLEYALKRELITTNRTGAYANTTIVGCNTRKYHCLLAVPIEKMNWRRHALLSSLDETLIQRGKEFHLGIHCYGDVFEPRGHKYIVDYENDPVPTITYQVGGMTFTKSILMVRNEDRVLIKYTLVDAHSNTVLRLKPFLSFRSIHSLTKCNIEADTRFREIKNGKAFKLYESLPYLNMQLSKEHEYVANPDWYYGITYPEEYFRGFDCKEDLFTPGFFEMPIKKGESIIFSASTMVHDPAKFKSLYSSEVRKIHEATDFLSTIRNSADRLFFQRSGRLEISSGFSWLEVGGMRDTGISAAGLTLYNNGDKKSFIKVIDDIIEKWKPEFLVSSTQVEAPLRLATLMQHYIRFCGDDKFIWGRYGKFFNAVMKSYIEGRPEVKMHDNGLLWAQMDGVALSWMNTYVGGKPVAERAGYQVETNALWYNALRHGQEMEEKFGKNKRLAEKYKEIADRIQACFYDVFWVEERKHLADYVDGNGKNIFTRPNQLYAAGLHYSPIDDETKAFVIKAVRRELLTTRGIRTLSPKNPLYKGVCAGNQNERDISHCNGSTRPWLLGLFVAANFILYGPSFRREAESLLAAFEEDMTLHGVGAVPEIYDGDPPHTPRGAIYSAAATAELLAINYYIQKYGKEEIR